MSVCERKKKVVLSFFQVWALITPATSIKQMNEIVRLTGLSLTKHKVVKYGLNVYQWNKSPSPITLWKNQDIEQKRISNNLSIGPN